MTNAERTLWTAIGAALATIVAAIAVYLGSGETPAPNATLTALPAEITVGASITRTWASTDATSVTLNGQPVALSGSDQLSPPVGQHTYTLTATGPGGEFQVQATVNVLAQPPPPTGPTLGPGLITFEQIHVHAGETLTILPGTELVRQDVPPAEPEHADGGIVVHGTLIAVRLPNEPPIVIRSANPSGHRGHFMAHAGSTVQLRGVEFRDFGRSRLEPFSTTNPASRYCLHWHEAGDCTGSYAEDCEVHDTVPGYRHGIVAHGVQGLVIRNNRVHHKAGAGIYCEDGTEACLIEDNLCEWIESSDPNPAHDPPRPDERTGLDKGYEGSGIWLRGPLNTVRNNVAKHCSIGYMLWFSHRTLQPIVEFADNEAHDCIDGLQPWDVGRWDSDVTDVESFVTRFKAVNCTKRGVYHYDCSALVYDSLNIQGCPTGWYAGDYMHRKGRFLNPTISGCGIGISPSVRAGDTTITIEGGTLSGNGTDIRVTSLYKSGGGQFVSPRTLMVRGVNLQSPQKLVMVDVQSGNQNWIASDRVFVEDWLGTPSDDFRVYYQQQAADAICPANDPLNGNVGCPVAGLTNAEAWAQHGVAYAGEVAPVDAVTRAGILGLVK